MYMGMIASGGRLAHHERTGILGGRTGFGHRSGDVCRDGYRGTMASALDVGVCRHVALRQRAVDLCRAGTPVGPLPPSQNPSGDHCVMG